MKRVFGFLLVFCLTLSFLSAAGEDSAIEHVFWHSASGEAGEALKTYVDRFNETIGVEKGISVVAVYQGSYSDSTGKLNSLLSAENFGDLPDVMQMDATGKLRYLTAPTAYTADAALSDHEDADTDDFLPGALANWRLSGVLLGLPFATSTTLTYYNASVLDEAPDTLCDLMDIVGEYDLDKGVCVYACVPNTPTLANWLGQGR